jgi:RNA polymerase sigma-70 factor (ECF subfamily)
MDPKCNKTLGLIVIIVRSISINIYNKRKRRKTIDIDGYENVIHDDTIGNPQLNIIRLDDKEYITKKLSQIKKEYADILTLKYYYGYSNREIADLLSIKEGNVRVRLMRAKNALHEIIGDESHEK